MKHVLIVEDDNNFKEMLEVYLKDIRSDITVATVSNVNGFILEYNKQIPDVIFLDIVLPGLSGIELLKFLNHLNCKQKIFLMSGFSRYTKEQLELADGFLEKPFELSKIKEIMNSI